MAYGYQMVTCPTTSRDPQRCCEAVRSAILATVWLLFLYEKINAALTCLGVTAYFVCVK